MKQIHHFIIILACVFLSSCEERTGYYDSDQKEIISILTGVEWKQTYEARPNFEPTVFEGEGRIYKFNVPANRQSLALRIVSDKCFSRPCDLSKHRQIRLEIRGYKIEAFL